MSGEDKSEAQLVRDVTQQISRARRAQVRTSAVVAQQKETFKRLIEIVHSPYPQLKSLAAQNIKHFIKDFPELEDDAINAVYDLCEDQEQKVRKDGYRAITSVSREQRKWVKRNADVLVQLLQSDEPEEVEVVEQQLTEHLDMDPTVTLGVLCDQVAPQDDAADDEEQAIRDRLRGLVLNFMTGKAKRAITERHANTYNSPAEEVLVQGMYRAISKLPPPDVEIIVKEILLPLPSFGSANAPRSSELLNTLMGEARLAWKSESPKGNDNSSIPRTRFFLELAQDIVVNRRIAPPHNLARFYVATFLSKVVLPGLTNDAQAFVIRRLAESYSLMYETSPSEITAIRNQLVEASGPLLSCFVELKPELRHWPACVTVLKACNQRLETSNWKPAPTALSAYQKLQDEASNSDIPQEYRQAAAEVQSLIRPLLQTSPAARQQSAQAAVPSHGTSTNVAKGMSTNGKPNGGRVQIKRKSEVHAERPPMTHQLPSRPPSQASTSHRPQSPGQGPGTRGERQAPPHIAARQAERQRTASAPNSGRATPVGDGEPHPKRQKGLSGEPSVPSLLSRLALVPGAGEKTRASPRSDVPSRPPSTVPAKRRAESEQQGQRPAQQQQQQQQQPPREPQRQERTRPADVNAPPPGGWSIKGAAKASKQPTPPAPEAGPTSLLDRLNSSDAAGGGQARKKRVKT